MLRWAGQPSVHISRDAAGDEEPSVMCSGAFFFSTLIGFDFLLVVVVNRVWGDAKEPVNQRWPVETTAVATAAWMTGLHPPSLCKSSVQGIKRWCGKLKPIRNTLAWLATCKQSYLREQIGKIQGKVVVLKLASRLLVSAYCRRINQWNAAIHT